MEKKRTVENNNLHWNEKIEKPSAGPREHIPNYAWPQNALIFQCDMCKTKRMFGRDSGKPKNCNPLLICWGNHEASYQPGTEHFPHTFLGVFVGGVTR